MPIESILAGNNITNEIWKYETLCKALSEEIFAFEKCVDLYNHDNESSLEPLLNTMHQAVKEIVPEAEVLNSLCPFLIF